MQEKDRVNSINCRSNNQKDRNGFRFYFNQNSFWYQRIKNDAIKHNNRT